MGLFDRGSNDGCTAHHFTHGWDEEWQRARAEQRLSDLIVRVPRSRHCQHEGCHEVDHATHPNEYAVPMEVLVSKGQYGGDPGGYADMLREFADKIDPEVDHED